MQYVVIIPARLDSRRFPAKPLADVAKGKTVLEWTYEKAKKTRAAHVIVATPDREIANHCVNKGMFWRPTKEDHPNGTSRCIEVFSSFRRGHNIGAVVNWQCDELDVDPRAVDKMINQLDDNCDKVIYTLVGPLNVDDLDNQNVVKAVCFQRGQGHYVHWCTRAPVATDKAHTGVYAFTKEAMSSLANVEETEFARAESLEQLSWIQKGMELRAIEMGRCPIAINVEEDIERFKRKVEKC